MNVLTVTADNGPAQDVDGLVVNNVTAMNYDFIRQVVFVSTSDSNVTQEYDLSTITTLTITASGTVYTLVLS